MFDKIHVGTNQFKNYEIIEVEILDIYEVLCCTLQVHQGVSYNNI